MKTSIFLNKLKTFFTTEKSFLKNASFVFGGKFYVAILSLLLTPIIARLYSPTDYGTFGLYNTLVQNLVIIGTLTLPLAIITAKKQHLQKLVKLSFSVISSFTLLFSVILLFAKSWLNQLFSTQLFSQYWYLILLGFLLSAVLATLKAVNIRLQHFKVNSTIDILEGSSAKLFNLSGGWIGLTGIGLLLSDVISKFVSILALLKKRSTTVSFGLLHPKELLASLTQLKKIPLYVMPSQWIGKLNNQFIIIGVALLYSKGELGQLVMAIGLLNIPLHLLSNTFQPVITEKLASLKGSAQGKAFFKQTFLFLFLIASAVFVTLILIPAPVYTWVLGNQWAGIGGIINVLALYYVFLHLDQAFENGFLVLEKQKPFLFFSLFELSCQIGVLALGYKLKLSLLSLLISLVLVRTLASSMRLTYLSITLFPSVKATINE